MSGYYCNTPHYRLIHDWSISAVAAHHARGQGGHLPRWLVHLRLLLRPVAGTALDKAARGHSEGRDLPVGLEHPIMIVFGYMDINNFSYAKLSSEVNKSGVFTRIGGPTRYEWLLEDYETYCVQDQEWTHYKMISLDSVITFYRDDEILFIVEPQQSLRYEGSIGVGTYYRNQAYFDDISVIELKSTGERKIEADKAFTIYPNPAHDLIIIEYDGTFQSFSIVNLHGQTIMQIPFKSDRKIEINIGDLEPGLYICSLVKMEGKTSMKRLIIL